MAYPITPACTKVRAAMSPWARLADRGAGWASGTGAEEERRARRKKYGRLALSLMVDVSELTVIK